MSPPLTLARRLLPLALALYGGAQAAVNISASFSPTTATVGSTLTYTVNLSSTEAVALSGAALNVTFPGVTSVSGTPVSNTCGFSLAPSGNTLALTQGNLGAAPAVGSATCQVTVQVMTGLSTGSFTTTIPNAALSTDQGLTNGGPASASFNLTPLTPPTLQMVATDARLARPHVTGNTSTTLALAGDIGGSGYAARVTNTNNVDVTLTGASINIPGLAYQTSLSGPGCAASITPQISDAQRPRPNFYTVDLGTLTVPANGSCLLNFNVIPELTTQSLYTSDNSSFGFNRSGTHQLSGTLNGQGFSVAATGIIAPPLGLNLLIGGGKTLTATTAATNLPLTLDVSNVTTTARSFSTSVALPAGLNDSAAVTGVSGPGCSVTGASLQRASSLNWVFSGVNVPAATSCRYSVTLQRGSAASSTLSVADNAVTTDWRPSPGPLSGAATQVQFTVPTTGTASHALAAGSSFYGPLADVLTLRNDTASDMSGVTANVLWDRPWTADLASSSTTCAGGTLSLNGQQLSMTGAAIPAGTSCSVVTAFLPASVTPQSGGYFYANASVASGPGFSSIGSVPANLFAPNLSVTVFPFSAATGERVTIFTDTLNRSVLSHAGETIEINTGGLNPDLSSAGVRCTDAGVAVYSAAIPQSSVSLSGNVLNLQLPAGMPTPVFTARSPYSASAVSELSCRVSIKASSPVAGTITGSARMSTAASVTGYTAPGGLNFTAYAAPTYSNSVSFSPTTVRAGQDATFTLSSLVPTGANVTSTWFRRELTLPAGLLFNTTSLTDRGGYWSSGTNINPACDAARNCTYSSGFSGWFIRPDRRTLVSYAQPYSGTLNLTVTPTQYGDLTTSMLAVNAEPLDGGSAAVAGDTSATLKVDPSLVIGLDWAPTQVYSEQTATLNVSVFNANPISDTISVPVTLGASTDTTVTPVLGGTCGGTLNWNGASRVATISGITLPSNGSCVASLSVRQLRVSSASFNAAQVPAGAARAQASNTGNQVLVGSTLSVQPIPVCLQASGLTLRNINLTSPGTGSLTANFTNTGTQALGSGDLTWSTPVIGATYRFDSAPGASTLQQAWANRAMQGALAVNNSTVLTATYQNPAGQARGSVITLPLSANSSGGLCSAVSTHTITTIKAAPSITTEQALCSVDASGTVTCAGFSTQPVTAKPCEVIRYRVTATNSGDAALKQGALQLLIPDGTLPVAWRNLSANALYRPLGGGAWQLNTGARLPLSGPLELRSRETGLIPSDLMPAASIQATVDVQVKGVGCVTAR